MGEIEELNSIFTDIADSIRAKLNVSTSYYPEDMADAIDSISGGGQTSEYSYEIITKSTGGFDAAITVKKYIDDVLEYSTDYPYQSLQVEPVFFDGLFSLQYGKGGQVKYTLTLYEKSDVHPSGYVYEWDYNETVDLTETFIVGGGVTVLSGTGEPNAGVGQNGNIYLKYNDVQAYDLPSNCTPLTYIETISGAYIDTGVTPTVDTSADLYGLVPLEGSRYGNLLGEGDRSGQIWAIRYTENDNGVQFLLGVDEDAINCNSITIGESYDIHAEKGKLIINGTEYTGTTAVSFSDPMSTLKIFSDGGQQAASARISRCKIYEDGVLIRDMVPARYESGPATAAGTIGMYDMVNDVFHYDTGGRTIVAGPVMVDNQITAAYVKVNGSWQNLFESSLDNVG